MSVGGRADDHGPVAVNSGRKEEETLGRVMGREGQGRVRVWAESFAFVGGLIPSDSRSPHLSQARPEGTLAYCWPAEARSPQGVFETRPSGF